MAGLNRVLRRIQQTDAALHAYFMEHFPAFLRRLDTILEWVFGVLSHGAFALIVAFLLAAAGMSGAVSSAVALCIGGAWLVSFIWIARSKWIRSLSVVARLLSVTLCGAALACLAIGILNGMTKRETSTETEAFRISDKSLSFINMTQDLNNHGMWWVTYPSYAGQTASPVAVMQYVEITNLLAEPETIKSYSLAIHTEDCGWTYLSPIPVRDVLVWMTYGGLEQAFRNDFRSNGFDYEFLNPIPAHHTVTGWWFFDSKVKCNVPEGSKVKYRMNLTTFSGVEFY